VQSTDIWVFPGFFFFFTNSNAAAMNNILYCVFPSLCACQANAPLSYTPAPFHSFQYILFWLDSLALQSRLASNSSSSCLLSAGIAGVSHHAQLQYILNFRIWWHVSNFGVVSKKYLSNSSCQRFSLVFSLKISWVYI
jgi:hypothetical protein